MVEEDTTSYGAIPQQEEQEDANNTTITNESCSEHITPLLIFVLLILAIYGIHAGGGGSENEELLVHWPTALYKMGGVLPPVNPPVVPLPGVPQEVPSNTTDAAAKGWVKMDNEPCNPLLGEEWLYGGERSINVSASVYFTPEVGDSAGSLSGIEVQYYGYLEENLIGTYFSTDLKSSKDGPYRTLSVALRNGEKEDLCDTNAPAKPGNSPYVMISPGMANKNVPVREDSPELIKDWKEGSCIRSMGYHWATDVVGGPNLTYKAENLVPVVPMYSSTDKTINGIFFTATSRKQIWPEGCPARPFAPCARDGLNMWDGSPGLTEVNKPYFYMCSNFCDKACHFTGSEDGYYTTMHFFFKQTFGTEFCGPPPGPPGPAYCRNADDYPVMVED